MNARNTAAHLHALGLARNPFPTTPDAEAYFHTDLLQAELAEAVHCVSERKGFVVVTGEVGLGKSTLARRMIAALEADGCAVALVLNTFLHERELLREINRDLGLPDSEDFGANLATLNACLLARQQQGLTTAILIDDAQNLRMECLELVRLLTNLETGQEKLVQIVLIAQPELEETLARREIRQLTSRIVKHVRLLPLSAADATRYVEHRLSFAGAAGRIVVTPAAHRALYRHTRGNPRRMHIILDRCLYGLVALRSQVIDEPLIDAAARESGLQCKALPAAPGRLRSALLRTAVGLATLAGIGAGAVLAMNRSAPAPMPAETAVATQPAAVAVTVVPDAPAVSSVTADPAVPAIPAVPACLTTLAGPHAGALGEALASRDWHAATRLLQTHAPAVELLALPAELASRHAADADLCPLDDGPVVHALWRHDWPDRRLSYGERGEGARRLQSLLAQHGFYQAEVDGVVGIQTTSALAQFQRAQGLIPSGIADSATLFMLGLPPSSQPVPQQEAHNG